MSRFENRRWLVLPIEKIDDIDFNQVHQPNKESLRKSIDGKKTFVKYEVLDVKEDFETKYTDVNTLEEKSHTTKKGVYGRPDVYSAEYDEYKHADILALLATDEWTVKKENQ